MKLLIDTHLLIWDADDFEQLSAAAVEWIGDRRNQLMFSVVSLWELSIKLGTKKDFGVNPAVLRRGLLDNGYNELPIQSEHACFISTLPPIHKDPFDRMLIAQATVEGITLITADATIAKYPGPIKKV